MELLDTNDDKKIDYWKEDIGKVDFANTLANDFDFDGRADQMQLFFDEFTLVGKRKRAEVNSESIWLTGGGNIVDGFEVELVLSAGFKKRLSAIDPKSPRIKPGDTIYVTQLLGNPLDAETGRLDKVTDAGTLDCEMLRFNSTGLGIKQLEYLMTTVLDTTFKHVKLGKSVDIRLRLEK